MVVVFGSGVSGQQLIVLQWAEPSYFLPNRKQTERSLPFLFSCLYEQSV